MGCYNTATIKIWNNNGQKQTKRPNVKSQLILFQHRLPPALSVRSTLIVPYKWRIDVLAHYQIRGFYFPIGAIVG